MHFCTKKSLKCCWCWNRNIWYLNFLFIATKNSKYFVEYQELFVLESNVIIERAVRANSLFYRHYEESVDGVSAMPTGYAAPWRARVHIQNHNLWTHQDHISRSHNQFEKVNRKVKKKNRNWRLLNNSQLCEMQLHYTFRITAMQYSGQSNSPIVSIRQFRILLSFSLSSFKLFPFVVYRICNINILLLNKPLTVATGTKFSKT